jgi:flagellar L-ring protein precursor FlgH
MKTRPVAPFLALLALLAPCAAAQSLMTKLPEPRAQGTQEPPSPEGSALYQISTFAVPAPKPREFRAHDLVTIVVDESSTQSADQTLKTDKKTNTNATLGTIIDPWELLELRLRAGATRDLKLLDVAANNKFDSKGNYSRSDRLSLKIQAEVIDVKPNGVLVLEARKFINKNGETQETVLTGSCRREDVTASNTVFSSQLANLSLSTKSTGQVDDAARKGLITRVLEGLFAF